MVLRFISALISVPIVIILLNLYHPYGSFALFTLIGILGHIENIRMSYLGKKHWANFTITFFFITFGMICGYLLNYHSHLSHTPWIYLVLGLAWGNDGAAMLIGRSFGTIKLAPSISPNKTVEGAMAGVVTGSVMTMLFFVYMLHKTEVKDLFLAMVIGIALSCLAIIGDLFMSSCKRATGLKDSGIFIPGQGGVLDKIDALSVLFMSVYVLTTILMI